MLQVPEPGQLPFLVLSHVNFWRQLGAAGLSPGFAACCSPRGASALILLPALPALTAGEQTVGIALWAGSPSAPPHRGAHGAASDSVRMVQISAVNGTRSNSDGSSSLNFPEQNSLSKCSRHFAVKRQGMVHPPKHREKDKHINGKKSRNVSKQHAYRKWKGILGSRGR